MKKEKQKRKPILFRIIRRIARIFFRTYDIEFAEEIEHGNVFVSNHAQVYGPVGNYLAYPFPKKIWVIGEMTVLKEVPAYAFEDFWRDKPKFFHWFYRLLSYIIAPISVYLMKHADTIPVYKDARLIKTFRSSVDTLSKGEDIFIFPEGREENNNIINKFQEHFVDLARLHYIKNKQPLKFYPVYTCKSLRKILVGKPIEYDANANKDSERRRVLDYLQNEITNLALSLPPHKVVPYVNDGPRVMSK